MYSHFMSKTTELLKVKEFRLRVNARVGLDLRALSPMVLLLLLPSLGLSLLTCEMGGI